MRVGVLRIGNDQVPRSTTTLTVPKPTSCAGCCVRTGTYGDRCDLLVGPPSLHVIKVVGAERLTVTVESPPAPAGCPQCGVITSSRGRRTVCWSTRGPRAFDRDGRSDRDQHRRVWARLLDLGRGRSGPRGRARRRRG